MSKIKYTFADGTTSEIEVTDEVYALHLQLQQEEKRNHWRETRRHISLYYLLENGVDFTDNAADSFTAVELRENDERIKKSNNKTIARTASTNQKDILRGQDNYGNSKSGKCRQVCYCQPLNANLHKNQKIFELDRELSPFPCL